jgi:hypothetical protein
VGKRALLVAVACAAILLTTGLIRDGQPAHEITTTAARIAPASTVAARGKITIDGQEVEVQGSCSATADGRSVNISLSGATPTKTNVRLDNAQPPTVASVVLATSSMAFLYQPGREGYAQATSEGNTFHITGAVFRYGFVIKPFDIAATCS